MNYSNKNTILTKSDWDLIKPLEEETKVSSEDTNVAINIGNYLISDFQYLKIFNLIFLLKDQNINTSCKAICIEYSLPSSSYATMALREILNDT